LPQSPAVENRGAPSVSVQEEFSLGLHAHEPEQWPDASLVASAERRPACALVPASTAVHPARA
jgi:hypothetical protein